MGLCLSRCGNAHQKAAVVAATISHQNSMENGVELSHDPNHSLRKFLHLYDAAEPGKRSSLSPRVSVGESMDIPHSSELFSLPDSDAERSCCISPSPARSSRASFSSSRAATSPKYRKSFSAWGGGGGGRISTDRGASPKQRNSFSAWGGRFSTDRTSLGCRKRIRPTRSALAFAGDQDLAAHQRLVEAIARLERLNDGKHLVLRGSSFCSSDLDQKTQILPTSRSGELNRPRFSTSSRSRHVRGHHQQLAAALQPPARVDHDDDGGSCQSHAPCGQTNSLCCSSMGDLTRAKKSKHGEVVAVAEGEPISRPGAFSQPKTMGNLVSLAGPVIKQMPLEKSVTNFLKEVENFVSLIEAPRLSLSTEAVEEGQDGRDGHHEPLIITTVSKRVEDSKCVPRLPSYRFEDADDEQFTFFEASFEDSERRLKEPGGTPAAAKKNHQRLVQSAAEESHTASEKSRSADQEAVISPVSEPPMSSTEKEPLSPANSQPAGQSGKGTSRTEILVSVDPGLEAKRNAKASDAARPALTEIDSNVMPTTKKSPIVKKSPSKLRALKGLRRGFSRSLDSRESSVTQVDFELLRNGAATSRLSKPTETLHTIQASSIEGKSTAEMQVTGCEENCADLRSSTVEGAASELSSPQGEPPSTSAGTHSRVTENIDRNPECRGATNTRREEGMPTGTGATVAAAPAAPCCSSCTCDNGPALNLIPNLHGELSEDSKRFLSKAFNSILKLLQVTDREQTPDCTTVLPLEEQIVEALQQRESSD